MYRVCVVWRMLMRHEITSSQLNKLPFWVYIFVNLTLKESVPHQP